MIPDHSDAMSGLGFGAGIARAAAQARAMKSTPAKRPAAFANLWKAIAPVVQGFAQPQTIQAIIGAINGGNINQAEALASQVAAMRTAQAAPAQAQNVMPAQPGMMLPGGIDQKTLMIGGGILLLAIVAGGMRR